MLTDAELPPVEGCLVMRRGGVPGQRGLLQKVSNGRSGLTASVRWLAEGTVEALPWRGLECGFEAGDEVWHVPHGRSLRGLGLGRIRSKRQLGARQQLLVEFTGDGQREWLPWQRLRLAQGPIARYIRGDLGADGSAERFRLRTLGKALRYWNENTGSLSRFDIDPLPHQIHLVHHILSSGNLNWLIADDVGLGKTIEAGLLIAALRQRGVARRILLVVPAGLTRQWQEDMRLKFGMDDFLIYGSDFDIQERRMWRLFDHVIVSMDRAKGEDHLESLLQAERWDLVIVDEAHRLTRRQNGLKFERSQRYRMAETLREHSGNLVLLTATPHQGRSDQFSALLELLRPEFTREFRHLEEHPEILADMVFRNRKSDVTDMEGNFIFHGQTSNMVAIGSNPELLELEKQLAAYLQRGYKASRLASGHKGRAIGFVMTVCRKLAASSIITLRHALARRLKRLRGELASSRALTTEVDERFLGETEEMFESDPDEFFTGEIAQLRTLIELCDEACLTDPKIAAFMSEIIEPILERNPAERVLVFTEYRGTQDYLVDHLSRTYGSAKVHVVNGSMNVEERLHSIQAFEAHGQFLISTEAGGEGINLHRRCHILVNYDLPWNPMRLAQRIGRLYRYGQKKHVLAFNLQANESADDEIIGHMYTRLAQVARDMASVDSADSERLVNEIVGNLADLIEVEELLDAAASAGIERTKERIEEALVRARESADLQRELFAHAASYDRSALARALRVDRRHLAAFTLGMVRELGGAAQETRRWPGRVWRLRLPEALRKGIVGFSAETLVSFEREHFPDEPSIHYLDMDDPLVERLLEIAGHYNFEGQTAAFELDRDGSIAVAVIGWQDEIGRKVRDELVVAGAGEHGSEVVRNPEQFSEWLLTPAADAATRRNLEELKASGRTLLSWMDGCVATGASAHVHPAFIDVIGMAATAVPRDPAA
jgi:ERCC4-related helicase